MATSSAPVSAGRTSAQRSWQRAAPWVYYGGLTLLLVLIMAYWLTKIIPGTVGRHIGYDSEGYVFALIVPAWIEFVRPRIAGRRSEWLVTGAAAAAMFVILLVLYRSTSITGSVKTLNETFLALAFVIPYVQAARRPSKLTAWLVAAAVLVVLLATDHSSLVWAPTNLAEGVVMMILAPLAFDVFDQGILQPDRPSPLRTRVIWMSLLVIIPLAIIALRHLDFAGTLGAAFRYAARPQEAFVGMLLIELYFAVRRWSPPAARSA